MDYLLLTLGGVLGSAHCVGMCGAFPLSLAARAANGWSNLLGQLSYTAGRLFGYGVAGSAAGFAGLRLMHSAAWLIDVQAWLALLAGVLLIAQGLLSAGVLRLPAWPRATAPGCLLVQLFAEIREAAPATAALRAAWLGVLTAFMPCGLLYAYLALAASSGHPVTGLGMMLAFGAGTAPLMVALGLFGRWISLGLRRRLWQVAAWCVVLTGVLSLARGSVALTASKPAGACLYCTSEPSK